MPYPRLDQRKCGDGKPSPYSGAIIDGLGTTLRHRGAPLAPGASESRRRRAVPNPSIIAPL